MFGVVTRAVATSLCLWALASPSFAADWSADTSLSQSLEGSDNRQLVAKPVGGTITSVSELRLNIKAATPTSRFDFNSNLNYNAYLRPGAEAQKNFLGHNLKARYEKTHRLFDYYFESSWTRTDASTVQRNEFGISTLSGEINIYTVSGGARLDLTPLDTLTLSSIASFSTFEFDNSTTTSNVTSATWGHRVSPNTDWNTSVGFNWLGRESAISSQTYLWTVLTGFRTDLSPRLTFVANGGAGIAPPGSGNAVSPLGTGDASGGTAVDWLANATLTYSLKNTQFSLFAAKAVAPTPFGEFQQSMNVGFTVRHDINWSSSLTLYGNFARTTAASTGEFDLYTASVTYNYQMARDWKAELSYRYNYRIWTETAQSNAVIGRLTYNYTILP